MENKSLTDELLSSHRKLQKHKTCQHCGFTGENIEERQWYVGGQGYVPRTYCVDTDACRKRLMEMWE